MKRVKIKVGSLGLGGAAFVVGLGLTVGKAVGNLVNAGIYGAIIGFSEAAAECRNETAQDVCKKSSIKHAEENVENDSRQ